MTGPPVINFRVPVYTNVVFDMKSNIVLYQLGGIMHRGYLLTVKLRQNCPLFTLFFREI